MKTETGEEEGNESQSVDLQKTNEARFLKALALDVYSSPSEMGMEFGIPAAVADQIVRQFVMAMARTRQERDWPRRLLEVYNTGVPREDRQT